MKRLMLAARMLAFAIAIAAVIDPAATSERRTKPEVSLVGNADAADAAAAAAAAEELLAKDYTVIRAPFSNAAATVMIGRSLPPTAGGLAAPVFAVLPSQDGPSVSIEQVDAPASASLEGRVPVGIEIRVAGGMGKTLEVTLSVGGLVVDRVTRDIGGDGRIGARLSFVPTTTGPASLRVVARVEGARDSAAADLAVDVRDNRWAVLFFDRRPSWMSTFVRRSLESDRRFAVASRVMTSRGISTEAGRPPSSLEDPTLLELYDVLVIGAAEAMTARDVAGLESFLRRRGGGVVLLFDERAKGGVYDRLTGVAQWSGVESSSAISISPITADSGGLRAAELTWPAALPAVSDVLARTVGDASAGRPVVWTTPVGSGRLIVSGALDAWKYRDPMSSGFDRFWRTTVAAVAKGATPQVDLMVSQSVVAPGEMIDVTVGVRDARLSASGQSARVSVGAALESAEGKPEVVRLWPTARVGELAGSVRAPSAAGSYRIVVSANGTRAEVPVVVRERVARAEPDEREIVAAFVGSRGGKVVGLDELASELTAVVKAAPRKERWYPMREGWWVVPFVVLLGMEWWWRRRQGLV